MTYHVDIVQDNLKDYAGSACLVWRSDIDRDKEEYFVVSSVMAPYTGFETLAFRASEDGEVINWLHVAGGRGMTREDVIRELEAGNDKWWEWWEDGEEDDDLGDD
jgi:hypothetical protein